MLVNPIRFLRFSFLKRKKQRPSTDFRFDLQRRFVSVRTLVREYYFAQKKSHFRTDPFNRRGFFFSILLFVLLLKTRSPKITAPPALSGDTKRANDSDRSIGARDAGFTCPKRHNVTVNNGAPFLSFVSFAAAAAAAAKSLSNRMSDWEPSGKHARSRVKAPASPHRN